jgi:hypothetical protein
MIHCQARHYLPADHSALQASQLPCSAGLASRPGQRVPKGHWSRRAAQLEALLVGLACSEASDPVSILSAQPHRV